ncbi:MAG: IS91 family transposase, partial [Thermoguttaceae bacterium]
MPETGRSRGAIASRVVPGAGRGSPDSAHERQVSSEPPARNRASQTWAVLIKRVYQIDPLACPECGGEMKVVAF